MQPATRENTATRVQPAARVNTATRVQLAARENTATHSCNIQPYYLLTHQQLVEDGQLLRMRSTKVVAACIFSKLLAAVLFLALDGTSMRTDPSITCPLFLLFMLLEAFVPVGGGIRVEYSHVKEGQQINPHGPVSVTNP